MKKALILSAILPALVFAIVEHYSFSCRPIPVGDDGYLIVHFVHGSTAFTPCETNRRLGGLFGGHAAIEADGSVYSFGVINKTELHYFPSRDPASYNAKINRQTLPEWQAETQDEQLTSIVIPVDEATLQSIRHIYQSYEQELPYDYALFGMRCASNIYEVLGNAGIFRSRNRLQQLMEAFYPRQLRRKMVRWAQQHGLKIVRKEGIDCRVWEQ